MLQRQAAEDELRQDRKATEEFASKCVKLNEELLSLNAALEKTSRPNHEEFLNQSRIRERETEDEQRSRRHKSEEQDRRDLSARDARWGEGRRDRRDDRDDDQRLNRQDGFRQADRHESDRHELESGLNKKRAVSEDRVKNRPDEIAGRNRSVTQIRFQVGAAPGGWSQIVSPNMLERESR